MNDVLNKEFGAYDDYSNFEIERKEVRLPAIYEFDSKYLMNGKEDIVNPVPELIPPRAIDPSESGAELFDYNYYYRYKALKGLERTESTTKSSKEIGQEVNNKI